MISLLGLDLQRLVVPRQVDLSILSDGGAVGSEEGIEMAEEGVHGSGLGGGDGEGGGEVKGFDGCCRDEDVLERQRERKTIGSASRAPTETSISGCDEP